MREKRFLQFRFLWLRPCIRVSSQPETRDGRTDRRTGCNSSFRPYGGSHIRSRSNINERYL